MSGPKRLKELERLEKWAESEHGKAAIKQAAESAAQLCLELEESRTHLPKDFWISLTRAQLRPI